MITKKFKNLETIDNDAFPSSPMQKGILKKIRQSVLGSLVKMDARRMTPQRLESRGSAGRLSRGAKVSGGDTGRDKGFFKEETFGDDAIQMPKGFRRLDTQMSMAVSKIEGHGDVTD